LRETASFLAIVRENPPGGLTCRSVHKKGIYIP